ncbi:MAG: alginate export family protein [Gammaproteobacteria bacterium]|nr:alginate export family protein [Gammaproteobacteria bacterium]
MPTNLSRYRPGPVRTMLAAVLAIGVTQPRAADSVGTLECWAIQLGAFSQAVNANQRLAGLGNTQCRISSSDKRHRILCGCYATPRQARLSLPTWEAIEAGAFVISTRGPASDEPDELTATTAGYQAVALAPADPGRPVVDQPVNTPHHAVAAADINPRGLDFFVEEPLAEQGDFARLPGAERADVLRRRPHERIPETELTVEVFGRPLTVGGELSLELEERKDYAFATRPDDLERQTAEFELKLFYDYSEHSAAFVELAAIRQVDEEPESDDSESESRLNLDQLWVYTGSRSDDSLGLQFGRQNFADDRKWWWDQNLDAVRLHRDTESLHLEIAIAQQLAPDSLEEDRVHPEEEDVLRLISSATWSQDKNHESSIFVLAQYDASDVEDEGDVVDRDRRDPSDLDALWLGVRRQGKYRLETVGRLYYWLDLGLVAGTEKVIDYDRIDSRHSLVDGIEQRDVRGAGVDIGAMWRTRLPGQTTFSLAYAIGSGDSDPDDDTDEAYRQTGLNRNDDKFRGVNGFHYYGDLLRPELSNIAISTFGLGFHFLPESSIDIVYHSYRQLEASDEIRGSRLDIDPLGNDDDIGSELDLIVGMEDWKSLAVELVISRFRAGKAFGELDGETASKFSFELDYIF